MATQAKVISRSITPAKGDLRYVLSVDVTDDKGKITPTQMTAFITPTQIQTANLLGEKLPGIGSSVVVTPSDVAGRTGELYCQIEL